LALHRNGQVVEIRRTLAAAVRAFNWRATGRRYHAARAAALAGCGRGEDTAGVGDPERARWRQQARQWLRADLAAGAKALDSAPEARNRARHVLPTRRVDPDLAGLREPGAPDKLPAEERKECLALWNDVEALLRRTVLS
jgi:serine/threonine-protein kinase